MKHKAEFSKSESLVVPEPALAGAPWVMPAPRDNSPCQSGASNRRTRAGAPTTAPALAATPQVTRVSPVFELASVSHGSVRQLDHSQYNAALADARLKSTTDAALALVVSRLDQGECLIATHSFQPHGSGCMGVSSRFHVESESGSMSAGERLKLTQTLQEIMVDWGGVFRTGLALLDEAYSFRQLAVEGHSSPENRMMLQFDSCTVANQTGMGFTVDVGIAAAITLPRWACASGTLWTDALVQTIKAARSQDAAVAVGVKISRFNLTGEQRSQLAKLDVSSDRGGRCHDPALSKLVRIFVDHAGEFLRIEPFVEVASDSEHATQPVGWSSKRAAALADIFAKEVLPLHAGARLGEVLGSNRLASCNGVSAGLDLTTVMPYSGSLPPLLAKPQLLRELDFPRHHGNHAVRLPDDGLMLGTAQIGGFEQAVRLRQADRSRHIYVVGGTGTGKSSLILHMIGQDLDEGRGLALCDPGGDLFEQVLGRIPLHRIDDVVIIDPSDRSMAVGLNPLDLGDTPSPHSVNRLIGDMLDIFAQLYDMQVQGGAGFESFFRNSMLLAATAPYESPSNRQGGPSFMTVLAVLRDSDFRAYLLSKAHQSFLGEEMGGEVVDFFAAAAATHGEQSFSNWVPYISNKLTRFITNPLMRQLLCSGTRTINFRKIMDEKKILLVNLGKGAIGALDASMIGMLVSKGLFGAALSRFDIPKDQRVPFTYYCDEFQNFVTPDIGTVLAEGRKWGLQAVLAHQTLGQLRVGASRAVLDAILGNIPTQLILRAGIEEAAILEPAMQPHFDRLMLSQLPDRQVAARLLIDNKVSTPFIFRTPTVTSHLSPDEQARTAALARQSSRAKYGITRCAPEVPPSSASGRMAPGATPSGAGDTAPPQVVMNGLVNIRRQLSQVDKTRLDQRIHAALEAWGTTTRRDRTTTLEPQAGHLYRTANESLVFVTSTTGYGGTRAVVLEGGHQDNSLPGNKPGTTLGLDSDGRFECSAPTRWLLGMSLLVEVDIPNVTAHWSRPETRCTFDWLLSQQADWSTESRSVVGGFHLTLNGSMVYVLSRADDDGEHKSIVLSGGHGVSSYVGEKVAESYHVDGVGRYCLGSKSANETALLELAAASGMSLAYRISTPTLDSPDTVSRDALDASTAADTGLNPRLPNQEATASDAPQNRSARQVIEDCILSMEEVDA